MRFLNTLESATGISEYQLDNASNELLERIMRGELFTIGKDYLGTGGSIEFHPLWILSGSAVINLHDESGALQQRLDYEARQDIVLSLGASISYGARGSEFGGLETADSSVLITASDTLYLRFKYFF